MLKTILLVFISEDERFPALPGSWFLCRSWFPFPTFLLSFAYLRGQCFIRVIAVIRSFCACLHDDFVNRSTFFYFSIRY